MGCPVAPVTVSTVDPVIPPNVALIVLVPPEIAVANPPLVIVATDTVADVQLTTFVRSCVLLSLNVPSP